MDILALLSISKIREHLPSEFSSMEIFYTESIDSTNTALKSLVEKESPTFPILWVCDHQSSGKGTHGRSFFSPKNSGLYFSLFLPYAFRNCLGDLLTIRGAVALQRALETFVSDPIQIKWVNDLYVDSKKVAGILTEMVQDKSGIKGFVMGMGINFSQPKEPIPPELNPTFGFLHPQVDRNVALGKILPEIFHCLSLDSEEILSIYRKNNVILGKKVQFSIHNQSYIGFAKEIDSKGHLLVESNGNIYTLSSGQATILWE